MTAGEIFIGGGGQEFELCECGGVYQFSRYCGAFICSNCGDHKGLCRCFCGWGLIPGEVLEDDTGGASAVFNGEDWDVDY